MYKILKPMTIDNLTYITNNLTLCQNRVILSHENEIITPFFIFYIFFM